ncbi:MAG: trypsin-like peptidase domain-containing protein [Sedimentisphaerales bacterium]|nr:trypsin-like peptidase domain-containing protein [Sedimentisphaerales bacterium]
MYKLKLLLLTMAAGWFCLGVCQADRITLKQGQVITGEILAEKDAHLIVDIGVTVLRIEKDKILDFQYTQGFGIEEPNDPNLIIGQSTSSQDKLYKTAKLQKTTIEKCVDAVAEAVVKVSTPAGMGSGFFINEQGYLITNYHVIEKETKIEVTVFKKDKTGFEKKNFKKVKIIAINPFVDLALLKVEEAEGMDIKHAYLGETNKITVGETVFAIGNPLGLERTVTDGVISTKNRAFEGLVYIQTNADINPGNSGGPLFNLAGEVIGVTNMGYIFYGGLGFAIPINYVKDFIENREAFAYDEDNPNSGFRYVQPEARRNHNLPGFLFEEDSENK